MTSPAVRFVPPPQPAVRPPLLGPSAGGFLEVATAALLAFSAFDPERWINGWLFGAAQSIAVGISAVAVAWTITRSTQNDRTETVRTRPNGSRAFEPNTPLLLLVAWLAWAAVGPNAFAPSVHYGVVLASLAVVSQRGGSIAAARAIAVGLILHLALAAPIVAATSIEPSVDGRLTLVSLEANELARVGLIGAASGAHLVLRGRRLDRAIGLPAAGLGAAAVGLSGSRTGAAALVTAVAILLVLQAPRWLLGLSLVLAGTAAAIAGTVGAEALPANNALQRTSDGLDTLNGRELLWPRLLEATRDVRLAGVGVGNDRAFIKEMVPTGWTAQHAHNLGLQLLTTTGVVGVALFTAALGWTLVFAAARSQRSAEAALALALVSAIVLESITEPVVRAPSFGWAAIVVAATLSTPRASVVP